MSPFLAREACSPANGSGCHPAHATAGRFFVFATFYMKTMMPLRAVAIASNVAFISYGYVGGMAPILILHVALLPLNLWRLHQTRQLVKKVRLATPASIG